MAIGKIVSLAVAGPGRLELEWDDGHGAAVDLGAVIAGHPGLKPIRAAKAFAKAALSEDGWSVEWPGGVDFGAPQLRRWADEQAGETMRADDFRAWMEAHALTLDGAASALGLSRRMIAYYASGEKVVPKTVLLATQGWQAHRRAGKSETRVAAAIGNVSMQGVRIVGSKGIMVTTRSSQTGQFVSMTEAKKKPRASVVERSPKAGSPANKKK